MQYISEKRWTLTSSQAESLLLTPVHIDASYVVRGLAKSDADRQALIHGLNGDLWSQLFDLYDECQRPPVVKIKSHMMPEQYARSRASFDDVMANETADALADKAAGKMQRYRNIDEIKQDNRMYAMAMSIAKRLSAIEAYCWSNYDSKRNFAKGPKASRKKVTEDDGYYHDHKLYKTVTGRTRRRWSRGVSSAANVKYWVKRKCIFSTTTTRCEDDAQEKVRRTEASDAEGCDGADGDPDTAIHMNGSEADQSAEVDASDRDRAAFDIAAADHDDADDASGGASDDGLDRNRTLLSDSTPGPFVSAPPPADTQAVDAEGYDAIEANLDRADRDDQPQRMLQGSGEYTNQYPLPASVLTPRAMPSRLAYQPPQNEASQTDLIRADTQSRADDANGEPKGQSAKRARTYVNPEANNTTRRRITGKSTPNLSDRLGVNATQQTNIELAQENAEPSVPPDNDGEIPDCSHPDCDVGANQELDRASVLDRDMREALVTGDVFLHGVERYARRRITGKRPPPPHCDQSPSKRPRDQTQRAPDPLMPHTEHYDPGAPQVETDRQPWLISHTELDDSGEPQGETNSYPSFPSSSWNATCSLAPCSNCGQPPDDDGYPFWRCNACNQNMCGVCERQNQCYRCQGMYCQPCYAVHDKMSCSPLSHLERPTDVQAESHEHDAQHTPPIGLRPPVPMRQYHTREDIAGIHVTHSPHRVRDITFCLRCGYWCQLKSEKLREPCPGIAPNSNNQSGLNRMKSGRHPRRLVTWPDGSCATTKYEVLKVDG